jgi:hypothetical protein
MAEVIEWLVGVRRKFKMRRWYHPENGVEYNASASLALNRGPLSGLRPEPLSNSDASLSGRNDEAAKRWGGKSAASFLNNQSNRRWWRW